MPLQAALLFESTGFGDAPVLHIRCFLVAAWSYEGPHIWSVATLLQEQEAR